MEDVVADSCAVCGKAKVIGNQISHSHRVSKRAFKPNLQNVRAVVGGQAKKLRVCTRCIRSGWVQKAL
jgi:large subunit ribosomal protein L28